MFISTVPQSEDPRNPLVEVITNLGLLLQNYLDESNPDPKFGQPFISRIYLGGLKKAPEVYPCIDIRFVEKLEAERRETGTQPSLVWPCIYSVRYFHDQLNPDIKDIEVTENLYKIADLIEYRNDLNGLCPRERAELISVTQETNFFVEFPEAGLISGGEIKLRVPVRFSHRTYWDASGLRDVAFASGNRH